MVNELTATFEGHAQQTDGGVEYWLAQTFSSSWATPNGAISPA